MQKLLCTLYVYCTISNGWVAKPLPVILLCLDWDKTGNFSRPRSHRSMRYTFCSPPQTRFRYFHSTSLECRLWRRANRIAYSEYRIAYTFMWTRPKQNIVNVSTLHISDYYFYRLVLQITKSRIWFMIWPRFECQKYE